MHRNDPAAMPIEERLDEVASLLAGGFLRLKRRTGCLPPEACPSPDSTASESAESSKIPADSTCHLSENPPLCAPRLPAGRQVNGKRPHDAWRPTWQNN